MKLNFGVTDVREERSPFIYSVYNKYQNLVIQNFKQGTERVFIIFEKAILIFLKPHINRRDRNRGAVVLYSNQIREQKLRGGKKF